MTGTLLVLYCDNKVTVTDKKKCFGSTCINLVEFLCDEITYIYIPNVHYVVMEVSQL